MTSYRQNQYTTPPNRLPKVYQTYIAALVRLFLELPEPLRKRREPVSEAGDVVDQNIVARGSSRVRVPRRPSHGLRPRGVIDGGQLLALGVGALSDVVDGLLDLRDRAGDFGDGPVGGSPPFVCL